MRLLRWFWVNLLTWSVEKCPTSFRLHRDVFSCRIKLQQSRRHLSILIALPFLVISGEITGDGAFDISATIKAIAAVTITKARSASKVIVCVYQEMTGFANVAFFSFHILFAGANASLLVALGNVINASFGFAFTTIKSAIYCTKLLRSESRLNITYHSQCSQSSNSWQRTCHTFHQSLLAYIRICHPEHIGVVSSLNQIKTQVHLKWKCKIVSSVQTSQNLLGQPVWHTCRITVAWLTRYPALIILVWREKMIGFASFTVLSISVSIAFQTFTTSSS